MKTIGNYNKISEELKKKIPTLKPGEVKTFQMLNGLPNNDPEEAVRRANPVLYGKTQLLTQYRIWDADIKNDKGEKIGGYVDIVLAKGWHNNEPTGAKMFVPGIDAGQFTGKFDLVGGRLDDQELWEVLYLSPERQGSPCPDESVPVKFKLLDFAKETEGTLTDFDIMMKALEQAKKMSKEDAEKVMASKNLNFGTEKELRAAVMTFAKEQSKEFLRVAEDPNTATKATLKKAFDAGILTHEAGTNRVLHGSDLLTTLKDGENVLTDTLSWVLSAKNGKQVLSAVEKKLQPATV
jgi:hypothetical protein